MHELRIYETEVLILLRLLVPICLSRELWLLNALYLDYWRLTFGLDFLIGKRCLDLLDTPRQLLPPLLCIWVLLLCDKNR